MQGRQRSRSVNSLKLDWLNIAHETMSLADAAAFGEKVAIFAKMGEKHGMNPHMVRRSVSALRALNKIALKFPDDTKLLKQVPFSAVEVLVRWHAYDRNAAIETAQKYLSGAVTVDQIIKAEVEARGSIKPESGAMTLDVERRAANYIASRLAASEKLDIFYISQTRRNLNAGSQPELVQAGVDMIAGRSGGTERQIAITILASTTGDSDFGLRRRLQEQVWKSLGLLKIGYRCIILVAGEIDLTPLRNWLLANSITDRDINIWQIALADLSSGEKE